MPAIMQILVGKVVGAKESLFSRKGGWMTKTGSWNHAKVKHIEVRLYFVSANLSETLSKVTCP